MAAAAADDGGAAAAAATDEWRRRDRLLRGSRESRMGRCSRWSSVAAAAAAAVGPAAERAPAEAVARRWEEPWWCRSRHQWRQPGRRSRLQVQLLLQSTAAWRPAVVTAAAAVPSTRRSAAAGEAPWSLADQCRLRSVEAAVAARQPLRSGPCSRPSDTVVAPVVAATQTDCNRHPVAAAAAAADRRRFVVAHRTYAVEPAAVVDAA